MFTPFLRFLMVFAAAAMGCLALAAERDIHGVALLLCAAILTYGYFGYGTVWLAFRAARKGKVKRAAKLLAKTRFPGWLNAQNRAYYRWLRGLIELDRGNTDQAREHLLAALNGKLRTTNDRCLVACALAALALDTGDTEGAKGFLERAKKEPHRNAAEKVLKGIEAKTQVKAHKRNYAR